MKLTANKNSIFLDFLKEEKIIKDIEKKYYSPLNIVFPKSFSENIEKFENLLKKSDIRYEIFYAHKSNKTKIFLEICKEKNIGVDVSSENELKNAINIGNKNIETTGPKSETFLISALQNEVLINIDSFCEIESIIKLRKKMKISNKTNILIRLSGFTNSRKSRFGIELVKKIEIISYLEKYKKDLNFLGCSFHIDSKSIEEKVKALEEVLLFYRELNKIGIRAKIINIGGGFGISYLENSKFWEQYKNLLKQELIEQKLEISWKNSSYGFHKDGNSIIGDGNIYTPFLEKHSEKYLEEILNYEMKTFKNIKIKDYLRENFIKLQIEPGRSLHNFTGITLSKVISVKEIGEEILVNLDINNFNLGSHEQELFSDPIVLGKNNNKTHKGVFFTGNLCLESDFVYRHKTFLGFIPKVGDLVLFLNTGGYLMDFYETNAISHSLPKKIIFIDKNNYYAI